MSVPSESPWRSGALLAIAGLIATSLLAGIQIATRERIAERDRQLALDRLAEVLPPDRYDNDPLADVVEISDPRLGPGTQTIHRAWLDGAPSALAITATATDGYAGPIRLIVGIDADGRVLGVRVLSHNETPGLGDPIETRRSDWILNFNARALGDPPAERWTVKPDGGDFDAFTGATITPRAVVHTVRRTLEFHTAERDRLYEMPAASK